MSVISIERAYTDMGTFGTLLLPNGYKCYTVERPWKDNQQGVSCIPEGTYILRKRNSPLIQRLTKGRYQAGWEVTNVPYRTFIMVHQANLPSSLEGCIAMGDKLGVVNNQWAVLNSAATFDTLMAHLEENAEWLLKITTKTD